MKDQEIKKALQSARAASQVLTWRGADKKAIAERTSNAREDEYRERQKLREVADHLAKVSPP